MVFKPSEGAFEMELWDRGVEAGPRLELVAPKDLGKYVKQALWEEELWSAEDEKKLMGIHAAQLRAFLDAAGGASRKYDFEDYLGGHSKFDL